MSLTGEAYAPPPPPTAVVQQAPGMPIPPAGGPIPPVAGRTFRQVGLPATAVSAEFMQQASQDEMPFGQRVEKCLAFAMPVLAIAMVIIKLAPQATNGTIMGCLFLWGLAFGASGLAPAYEGAFLDGMIAFVLSFFFGPAIGLLGALGLGMIKQEWSFAALLLGHLLARLVLIIGFPEDAIYFSVMPYAGNMSTMAWMSFGGVCCTYAGWILSSFFRPVNE